MKKQTICVDFDGVIHSYEHGWQGGKIYGTVMPGFFSWAISTCQKFNICIYSTRSSDPVLKQEMEDWVNDEFKKFIDSKKLTCSKNIFSFPTHKPIASIYVDDRAVNFNGSWDSTSTKIQSFRVWQDDQEIYERLYKFIDCVLRIPYKEDEDENVNVKIYASTNSDCDRLFYSDREGDQFKLKIRDSMKWFINMEWNLREAYEQRNIRFLLQDNVFECFGISEILKIFQDIITVSELFDLEKLPILNRSHYELEVYFTNVVGNKDISLELTKMYLQYS